MYISPRIQDCLDENGNFSQKNHDHEDRYLLSLMNRTEKDCPIARAVVILDNGSVTGVVVENPRIDISILDVGYHLDGQDIAPDGETVCIYSCDCETKVVDKPFVERVFGADGTEHPVHIRINRAGLTENDRQIEKNYLTVLNSGFLCGADQRKLHDPESIVQLVRWLELCRDYDYVVAFHFRDDGFVGCTIEQAGVEKSMLLQPRNLFQAVIKVGANSVVVAYRPAKDISPNKLKQLLIKDHELIQAGEILGIELKDFLITGTVVSARKDYVSLRNTGKQSTPFDEEKKS